MIRRILFQPTTEGGFEAGRRTAADVEGHPELKSITFASWCSRDDSAWSFGMATFGLRKVNSSSCSVVLSTDRSQRMKSMFCCSSLPGLSTRATCETSGRTGDDATSPSRSVGPPEAGSEPSGAEPGDVGGCLDEISTDVHDRDLLEDRWASPG
jgi:hypothetical protein